MKRLSLLLIILLANISFSQKTYKASKTTISSDYNGEKVFHVKSGKPITGIVIEKYENEKKKYYGEFVKSLPTGTHWKYFESGFIKEMCDYKNGQLNGEYVRWYDSPGIPQIKCYFKNGKINGLYYELKEYPRDTIKKLFYVNGVLDGKAYYWGDVPSESGRHFFWAITTILNYKLGIKDGFQREVYEENGKTYYKDGKSIPFEKIDTSYADNGEGYYIHSYYYDGDGHEIKNVFQCFSSGFMTSEDIEVDVNSKYVKKIKTWRRWYKNGNISEENIRSLKDDCPSCDWSFHKVNYEYEDSIVKKWFENGNLKYENYTDSIIKEWFENGNLKYEIIKKHERILSEKRYYTNGNIKYEYLKSIEGDGYEKWWNEKGLLQCEGFFDKRSKWDKKYWKGTFKTYDEERLISIEHYEEGEKSGVHKYWDENDRLTESAFYSEEQIEEEKQKFVAWKKNTRFSISYKVEIVNNIIKCSYCSYKKVNKNLNFPNLNLSNYGNEKYMRKLWDEHKQIIESEIIGNIGFRNHPVFDEAIFGKECKNCGRPRVEDKKSTFENKTFKN